MSGERPKLYSIGDVAARVGFSISRLRQLESEGKLPSPIRISGLQTRVYTEDDLNGILLLREKWRKAKGYSNGTVE